MFSKLKWLVVLLMIACGAPIAEQENLGDGALVEASEEELAQEMFELSINRGACWRDDDGWLHRACDPMNAAHVCVCPAPRTDGLGSHRRLVNVTIPNSSFWSGVSITTARDAMMSKIQSQTIRWKPVATSQGSGSNLRVVADESIYSGTPPNTSISFESIAHVSCTEWGVELDGILWPAGGGQAQDILAYAMSCKQVTMWLDVGSWSAWTNQWASTAQKQASLNSLLMHAGGVAIGLPATDGITSDPMRLTLTKTASPVNLTTREICLSPNLETYDEPELQILPPCP